MIIVYETTRERGTTILIPGSMVDSMNPAVAVAISLAAQKAGSAPSPETQELQVH
jgi:hypothetical protein